MFFDATTINPADQYEALPAGDYEAMATDATIKPTKDGSGKYLELKLQIQGGAQQGRTLFDRLNLVNRNPKAVEIAQRQLSQLCHATGVLQIGSEADVQKLCFKPVVVKVSVKNDPERGMQNEVKGYKAKGPAAGGFSAAAPQAFAAPRVAAQQPASAAPPWAVPA